MAEKDEFVRKVFVLPSELVERINEFRHENGLDSEVEAVRRLLDGALLNRDTTRSILIKMMARYKTEKDIRIIARDILSTHPLVESITYQPGVVGFTVTDDHTGAFTSSGGARYVRGDKTAVDLYYDKNGKVQELDDDIPF